MTKPEHKIQYQIDGKTVFSEQWHLNGQFHRTDGPAEIQNRADGTIFSEQWYLHGQFHRTDGPARIQYRADGTVLCEEWYLSGKEIKVRNSSSPDFKLWKKLSDEWLVEHIMAE